MQRRTVRGFLSQVFLVGRTHPSDPFSSTTLGPHSGRRAVQTLAPPHRTSGKLRTSQLPCSSLLLSHILDVKVKAPVLLLSQLLPHMEKRVRAGRAWSWGDSILFSSMPQGHLGRRVLEV